MFPEKLSIENQARITEARKLLKAVENILERGTFPESAVWRLVEAAGLVVETLPEERKRRLAGLKETSGRGYRLAEPGQVVGTPNGQGVAR